MSKAIYRLNCSFKYTLGICLAFWIVSRIMSWVPGRQTALVRLLRQDINRNWGVNQLIQLASYMEILTTRYLHVSLIPKIMLQSMQTFHTVLRVSRAVQLTSKLFALKWAEQLSEHHIDLVSVDCDRDLDTDVQMCKSALEFHHLCPGFQPSYPWHFASTEHTSFVLL